MTTRDTQVWMIWMALLLPLIGCGGGQSAPGETHSDEARQEKPAAREGGAEHGAEKGVLTVDPEVLRDLKLTTFPAELRPGGEGVTALGELKVDEQA
jgi:cobalt-zinc-cadmium efflux system membrane fusion protein